MIHRSSSYIASSSSSRRVVVDDTRTEELKSTSNKIGMPLFRSSSKMMIQKKGQQQQQQRLQLRKRQQQHVEGSYNLFKYIRLDMLISFAVGFILCYIIFGMNNNNNNQISLLLKTTNRNNINEQQISSTSAVTTTMDRRTVVKQQQIEKRRREPNNNNNDGSIVIYDIAIIGCGPAGLSAAIFASRSGLSVIVLGSDSSLLSETPYLDNYPSWTSSSSSTSTSASSSTSGPTWLSTTKMQAINFGTTFALPGLLVTKLTKHNDNNNNTSTAGTTSSFFTLDTTGNNHYPPYRSKSVIIATGSKPKYLNLPNEKELWTKSLHNCAICDGSLYANKVVVVVGGGNAAIDGSILIARHAKKVILIHRRNEFRSTNQPSINILKQTSNIQVLTPYNVIAYETTTTGTGTNNNNNNMKLTGVKIQESSASSSSINRDNNSSNNSTTTTTKIIPCGGLFMMIGSKPNTDFLKDTIDLDDETGLIVLRNDDKKQKTTGITSERETSTMSTTATTTSTSLNGVFAAGEVTDVIYRQAITAASSGSQAAIDAERWLRLQQKQINNNNNDHRVSTTTTTSTSSSSHTNKHQQKGFIKSLLGTNSLGLPKDTQIIDVIDPHAAKEHCDLTLVDCIKEVVKKYPVVVFSKPWCPYCRKAIETFQVEGIATYDANVETSSSSSAAAAAALSSKQELLHIIDLTSYGSTKMRIIQDSLNKYTGRRTVPNVFINGKNIGGGDETVTLHRKGKLKTLLQEAGAIK